MSFYLMSGSNSGIGKNVALEVAKRGGTVHMVCRNQITAKEACDEIKTSTGNDVSYLDYITLFILFTQKK